MSTRWEEYDSAPEVEGAVLYEPGWYLLEMPGAFQELLVQELRRAGELFKPVRRPHVSVMKNEAPSQNQGDWGVVFVGERVKVKCGSVIRKENGLHYWIDCYSPRLCAMREHFGLPTLRRPDGVY